MTLPPRATDFVCAALLLVAALTARLPGIDGDLWLDEAWVANSVLAPTWREMFFYPPWMQTTPPLYLVITRCLVAVFGDANWVFRLLSVILGLVSVLLAVYLGRKLYSPWAGWLAGALVTLSASAAMFSKEGKTYSAELCVALALMIVVVEVPRWWWAAAAMLVSFGLAYSSVAFFPGVILAYVWAGRWRQTPALLATVGLPLALTFVYYIQPNRGEDLREMWTHAFPHDNWLGFYLRTTQTAFVLHQAEWLRSTAWLRYGLLLAALGGLARCAWQMWQQQNAKPMLTAVAPLGCAILLNAAGLYPYDAERFSFYLFGAVVLLVVAGLDWLLPALPPQGALLFVLLAGATLAAAAAGAWPRRVDAGLSAARHQMQQEGANAGDLLFVAPLLGESYVFEQRRQRFPMTVFEGRQGAACCPRDGRWQPATDAASLEAEMDQLLAAGTGRRIWMLHFRLLMLNEEGRRFAENVQRDYLRRKGCREEFAREFQSTVLSAYRCPLL